ncbi:hypothetical protein [Mucilaginibacter lacusdianchii]|uniref:hypothetical protein n=1 Tax=Mucilaginibacter lacusdianchii TaxID=2684211 RepID=UPI00131D6AD1|nr:hypothetical protein [Mucilaginibacter sp. JXJ CY 39]
MKDYQRYFKYKTFILDKQSRLNSLKNAALKAGDTAAYLKLATELVKLNKRILALNYKMKQLMDDMNKAMKNRYNKFLKKPSIDEISV